MELELDKLKALYQVSVDGSFSKAAKLLCLSQPALSKKIKRLEDQLGLTLLIRGKKGVSLTPAGFDAIRHYRLMHSLDQEFLQSLKAFNSGVRAGDVRVACYSSICRSAVIPCLAPILCQSPFIQVNIMSKELHELPDLLLSGQVDFILTTLPIKRHGIQTETVGSEEFVHVRPANSSKADPLPYLDHDNNDQTTHQFLERQGLSTVVGRNFYDDIYAILDALRLGCGQAIVSRHLISRDSRLKIVKHKNRMVQDVFLQYFRNTYHTHLQGVVVERIRADIRRLLSQTR